ncbi:MAG: glutathione S-transferase C-terminal domain-containing protein [Proteobacteria bacterium]|nr:glutathione S-transferase C-terminal domain-containing protein [Pseudomonadota bacterium]
MGMLREGQWIEDEAVIAAGTYVRQASVFNQAIGIDVIEAIAAEPGRFHLIASQSCPWSHRTMLFRTLKNLSDVIPLHILYGPRVEGYAANGGADWTVPGTDKTIRHLHQLYSLSEANYTGRVTVPILWDSKRRQIVSNESAAIIRGFDAVRPANGQLDFTLVPGQLKSAIDCINEEIYKGLSNGVYRAVFAERQEAYDLAVQQVFRTLEDLNARLASQRYLLSSTITEADWRLFPTLMRFDAVYYVQHRCSYRRLVDYPDLWAYARDLYAWQGVAETLDLDDMRKASYANEPHGIVAIAPDADWHAPHGREALGSARIALRSSKDVKVDPARYRKRTGS